MSAYLSLTVAELLESDRDSVVGSLAIKQSGIKQAQLNAWADQVAILQSSFLTIRALVPESIKWSVLFEFQMLRIQKRIDVVILAHELILSIEFKIGGDKFLSGDKLQAENYAFDLRDFHAGSHDHVIVPILCTSEANGGKPYLRRGSSIVTSLMLTNRNNFSDAILGAWSSFHRDEIEAIDSSSWEASSYSPVPNIIETAEQLYGANNVREIHEALSDQVNLTETTDLLIKLIAEAQEKSKHLVCFVTGVPGSGKTLTGLNAVHDPRFRENGRGAGAFLSGNTPLVAVLREALALDESKRTGKRIGDARSDMRATIQNLMHFLEEYIKEETVRPPHDHVVVFDEAQRAWDESFGKAKFGREASEPELFLNIMSRHEDWSVIIALVGGGQEINKGEGGLQLWGEAIGKVNQNPDLPTWEVCASNQVVSKSSVTAGSVLFDGESEAAISSIRFEPSLNLPVSIRSHRCEVANDWIDAVLKGNRFLARSKANELDDFRIYLTRSLDEMRRWLATNTRGFRRCGLLASSDAKRLRAYGLGVAVGALDLNGVVNWFVKPRDDVRSSYSMEITANEYACQGLELDNVGLCWGGDMNWREGVDWEFRKFSGTNWQNVGKTEKQENIRNTYRVLMSRARDTLVIWVPPGDADDPTRSPAIMDQTAQFLSACGVRDLALAEDIAHLDDAAERN